MTSSRAYRSSKSVDDTITELNACRGVLYDPPSVDAFLQVVTAPEIMSELGRASLQVDLGEVAVETTILELEAI